MSTGTRSNPFGLKAKPKSDGGGSYTPPPVGNHPAALVAIVDLGTQHVKSFEAGEPARDVHQVYLVWELFADEPREDGTNHMIGAVYTLSSHPKAGLRVMLEGWRGPYQDGDEFDPSQQLGKKCLANVVHQQNADKSKTYAKLKAISPIPKAMEKACPDPTCQPVLWLLTSDEPLPDTSGLPFIYGAAVKDVIEQSAEWKATYLTRPLADGRPRPDPNRPLTDEGESEAPF